MLTGDHEGLICLLHAHLTLGLNGDGGALLQGNLIGGNAGSGLEKTLVSLQAERDAQIVAIERTRHAHG